MKTCKIVNDTFSWIMYVDNQSISFNGFHNAIYFSEHYGNLGYTVTLIVEQNKNK